MKQFCTLLLFVFLSLSFSACSSNDSNNETSNCDKQAEIITDETYNSVIINNYSISNVSLDGDCLSITLSSSGCNGNTWEMNLYSINTFFDVFPLQRSIKVELINNELCLAIFSKTLTFDLVPFQIEGQSEIPINIEGWNDQIIYQY